VHELDDEMARWEADGLFTAEEKKWVHRSKILAFCQSDLGQRMAQSPEIRREYPFSVLFTGGQYLPDLERDERVLVQGVVDCLFREDDKWVLVDYKTDRLEKEKDFCKRYAVQLALYKRALEQISGADIKDVYIYSFYLNTTIPVSCT
jgi:ATP-dependent helicase/nuclease subunit A